MKMKTMNFKNSILFALLIASVAMIARAEEPIEKKLDAKLQLIRIYGDNEMEPPILQITNSGRYETNVGSEKITVELDITADVPPSLYARFVHCTVDWEETENLFYQGLASMRFSNIQWESATYSNSNFSYRGRFSFPDLNIKFQHSGNWKILFYDYNNDKVPFASAKFFVIESRAGADISIWNGMYSPIFNVSSTCYNIEASVWSNMSILDNNVHTCVLYKNHRFEEPIVITQSTSVNQFEYLYRYRYNKIVSGFISARKSFRAENVPAENEYRVLDLTNLAYFPRSNNPVRLPLSDLRRNGTFFEYDDEGAMLTGNVSSTIDDYVYVEFVLEPDGVRSADDIFLIGSFNNWTPTAAWQMYFDDKDWYYKLRQWVRRARHNYLYASGELNYDMNRAVRYSTDEFEGNTSLNDHSYIAFFYYKDVALGGYDAIIAAKRQSISRRY